MAELIASGTTLVTSAEFTLTGESSTLFLTAASVQIPAVVATVEIKSNAGTFHVVGSLTNSTPAHVLTGPGTYRVSRQACTVAVGVDRV